MEALNDFSRGMQSDISKLIQAKNTYLEAINFRPFTELGASNTSLVTIKGNECAVNFPTMNDIYKLKIDIRRIATTTDNIDIDITGSWGTDNISAFVVNSSTDIYSLYQLIIALPNYGTEYTAAYKDDYIMLYQTTTTTNCASDINTFSVSVTENVLPGTQNSIWFVKPDGTFAASPAGDGTAYIPAPVDPLIPIGYTTILEDIYMFVAVDDPAYTDMYSTGVGIPVNDDYSAPGYIFKLSYDESTTTTNLTLIYGAYLNFTKYAAIAPSAAIGRYESDEVQRIYWSDFYNKVKTLNVTDPQVMALNPVLTGVTPSVNFDMPIMTNIISGSLNAGTYELCYRLKQSLGAITNYSVLSNMVHLAAGDINDFAAYEGSPSGTNTGKGIRWKVSNLDIAYDRVEFIVTFRDTKTDVCKVYSHSEVSVPTSGMVNVDVTSLASADEILLTDFLAIQSSFTHAKTVDTKDNRLFWGNVKSKQGALPAFDARAFRAFTPNAASTDIKLTHNGISANYTLATAIASPDTNDSINEYYDSTGAFGTNACYYVPNDATGKLGGAGANISYEFGTVSTQLDYYFNMNNYDGGFNIYINAPFRETLGSTSNLVLLGSPNDSSNQTYIQDSLYCLKSPYRSTVLRGFQHEEIYRFGLEAYDLEGRPYFVKWIADIKMPSYGDPNPNPDTTASAAGVSDFRLSYDSGGNIYGQTLYIKFTVDVSSIEDVISGYRIVRMERDTDANKTILGCGMISPTYIDGTEDTSNAYLPACFKYVSTAFPGVPGGNHNPYNPFPSQNEWEGLSIKGVNGSLTDMAKMKTFDCFDFFRNGGFSYSSGDKILIRSRVVSKNYQDAMLSNNYGYRWWDYANVAAGNWYNIGGPPRTTNVIKPKDLATIGAPGIGVSTGSAVNFQTGFDSDEMAYYIHKYIDDSVFGDFATLSASAAYTREMTDAAWVGKGVSAGSGVFGNGLQYNNYGRTYGTGGSSNLNPCWGNDTLALGFGTGAAVGDGFAEYNAPYNCTAWDGVTENSGNYGKLIALYYRPNSTQYGGNTYAARAGNEYIACGSYIPITRNNLVLANNPNTLTQITFGGDVYLNYWDNQKACKDLSDGTGTGPTFTYYSYIAGADPGNAIGTQSSAEATVSVTHMFPCTNMANQEMRYGPHINTSLNANTYSTFDSADYALYHSNEANIVKYYSEPLDFVESDKWINRVYYSEVKYNNETSDSWQVYKTNNFYDVEGNYGAINALVAFKENLYYIQERGFGILYVNPMTAVTSDNNIPVVLGLGATIQRHNYIKLDVGTMHQWSVFRSPDNISFIDSRHKTQYLFNGQSLSPVSDIKGQRNFFVKRFHPNIILRDNPIINRGVHTTYDYYNKEFITTFNNYAWTPETPDDVKNEKYTIAYSEPIDAYSSLYTFTPKMYLNNNRYIFSFDDTDSFYVHNMGDYGSFYGVVNPAYVKILVNDHPTYTKVFDNLMLMTESIDDQVEWIDEIITPTSNSQAYSDNINKLTDTFNSIRCYTDAYNSDWVTLTLNTNIKKKEQSWFTPVPRNKVEYNTLTPSTTTIFDPTVLTKTDFGERMRDKYMVIDLKYNNTNSRRFIVHNVATNYRISSR